MAAQCATTTQISSEIDTLACDVANFYWELPTKEEYDSWPPEKKARHKNRYVAFLQQNCPAVLGDKSIIQLMEEN